MPRDRFIVGDCARPLPEHDAEPPAEYRDFSAPMLPRGEIVRVFPFGKGQLICFKSEPSRLCIAGMYERETGCDVSTK
jgi:hypothetical protein